MIVAAWRAPWAMFKFGARQVWLRPTTLLGHSGILFVLIVSYGAIFRALPEESLGKYGLRASHMIWYFTITELVLTASSRNFLEIQNEIRSGAIEVLLLRPVAFWRLKLAEWFGQCLARLTIFTPVFFCLAWIISGEWGLPWTLLPLFAPTLAIGVLIMMCSHIFIGCATIYTGHAEPLYWIWQKSMFLLGSLFWPLVLYPDWARNLAAATPFPAILSAPGGAALGSTPEDMMLAMARQIVWLTIMLSLSSLIAGALRRRVRREGL